MTLVSVSIITDGVGTLTLPLVDNASGYYVRDITGLDPVKAELVSSSFGTVDGAQYQSSRRETRNILIKLGLSSDYVNNTISAIRQTLYYSLMPKTKVLLRFNMSDNTSYDISGRVESFESPLFTKDPEATISIICFDPDFSAQGSTIVSGSTVATTVAQNITYSGNTPTGFIFKLSVNRAISSFNIYHTGPDNSISNMGFTASLLANDVVYISTVAGNKYAILERSSAQSSILYAISLDSGWPHLLPGVNKLRVYTTGAAIPFTLTYTNKYGGL